MSKRFVTTKVEIEGREETKVVELPSRNPDPWDDTTELHVVGQRVTRMDALEKVTGEARFTADVHLPGMLFAAILRAPVPRGRVTVLDLTPALALDGVRGGIIMADVPDVKLDGVRLFDQTIHYANQPIAAICADSLETAERALEAITLDVERLPHAVTIEQALAADAPSVRQSGNTHKVSPRVSARGDVDAGLREADVTVTREYRTPRRCTRPSNRTARSPSGRADGSRSTNRRKASS